MIAQEIAAGRALDALVAERVLGLRVSRTTATHLVSGYDDPEGWGDSDSVWEDVPHYSTDIAAAWLVLGKFTSYDLGYEGEVNGETSCTVGYWPGSKYVYAKATVRGNDAPLAICRAALKAIG